MFERLGRSLLAHRAAWALGAGLALLLIVSGAARLRVDFDTLAFFGTDDPERDHLESFRAYWGPDDALLLLHVAAGGERLTDPARLRAIEEGAARLERTPGIGGVRALTRAPALAATAPGLLDMSPVLDTLPAEPDPAWEDALLVHPVLVPALLSEDGTAAAVIVELEGDATDVSLVRPLVFAVRDALEPLQGVEGLTWSTAGIPAVRADFFDRFFEDQSRMLPMVGLLMLVVLAALFRRPYAVASALIAAAVPTAATLGLMGWAGEPIGILTQAYPTLLPVIAVADAIHLVTRFHEEARRRGGAGAPLTPALRDDAIVAALHRVGTACFLTSVTTGLGFLSLLAADMPALRRFGVFAALGIAAAYLTVLVFVPLVLSLARGTVPAGGEADRPTPADRFLLACAGLATRRPGAILAATALSILLAGWYGTRVVVDNHLTGMLDSEHAVTRANRAIDEQLGGIVGLEVDVQGPAGTLGRPDVLRALLDLEDWARAQPEVRATRGPASLLAALSERALGRREIPGSPAGVSQLLVLAEGDPGLSDLLDEAERTRGRTTLRVRDDGGRAFEAFSDRAAAALAERMAGLGVESRVTGTPYVAYRGINRITEDIRDSLLLAFLTIGAVIAVLLRNTRLTLLLVVPNALPLLFGYGLMGASGWLLDPMPAVTFTLALGIAVDDTLHLIARYREEREDGRAVPDAVRASVLHTGRAVVTTTVLLCAGFGANLLSSFQAFFVFGALGAAVIFTALICDLFLLPALLVLFAERGEPT